MKCLGYIVSKRKIKNCLDYIKVVKSLNDVDNESLPTLIVGIDEAKKVKTNDFSVMDRHLVDNKFWTFGKTEKREIYEKDLSWFYRYVLSIPMNNIKYCYLNPFKITYGKTKTLLNSLNSCKHNYIYISNGMIYLYGCDGYVIGISTKILNYMNIDIKHVYRLLYKNKLNTIYKDDTFMSQEMKEITNDKKYIIPYFLSILN